ECTCPDSEVTTEPQSPDWLEMNVVAGFRVWQLLFLSIAGLIVLVVFLCCFMKCRIPRTKQEIEADYHRRQLTRTFRSHLNKIGMDDITFKVALEKVQERYEEEHKSETENKTPYSDSPELSDRDDQLILPDDDKDDLSTDIAGVEERKNRWTILRRLQRVISGIKQKKPDV
ncbi:transmembrane inner ear expressed protein-like, partial [Limulus polyphemus]|uniref:Transmembrane inner ear expressed protein-like n=1 Tax=Limulus polyphemus TaxID=6850 RepID=A0ABM1TFJ6_LIMPO